MDRATGSRGIAHRHRRVDQFGVSQHLRDGTDGQVPSSSRRSDKIKISIRVLRGRLGASRPLVRASSEERHGRKHACCQQSTSFLHLKNPPFPRISCPCMFSVGRESLTAFQQKPYESLIFADISHLHGEFLDGEGLEDIAIQDAAGKRVQNLLLHPRRDQDDSLHRPELPCLHRQHGP